ncbi:DoxX family protein [Prescottella sp. R16]|uniref:DoxX family protein n=1 Tax=Prescottella sp. R16 TaxID=3064529 RepID=UPI00272E8B70|nr:MauE/DoxX family redox-associated membrane protein [Prescottella sp. R16]
MHRQQWTLGVSFLARLGLAAVWLVSGWIKFADPTQTVVAVRAYQLLPEDLVRPVAYTMPMFEIALGLFLVIGLGVRIVAVVSAATLLVLIGVIVSVWARGLSIDCGCFGGGGAADVDGGDYALEIARDIGFLALAVWLTILPRSPLSLGPRSRPRFSVPPQAAVAE